MSDDIKAFIACLVFAVVVSALIVLVDYVAQNSDAERRTRQGTCVAQLCGQRTPPDQLKACIDAVADVCLKD